MAQQRTTRGTGRGRRSCQEPIGHTDGLWAPMVGDRDKEKLALRYSGNGTGTQLVSALELSPLALDKRGPYGVITTVTGIERLPTVRPSLRDMVSANVNDFARLRAR